MSIAGPRRITVLPAASADETLGKATPAGGYCLQTYVLQGNGVTSSGVITFEEASVDPAREDYNGTWSIITTANASDVNTGSPTGSAQKFIHIQATAGAVTRPRISTVIGGGGTVMVFLHQEGQ